MKTWKLRLLLGWCALLTISSPAATFYANVNGMNPTPPYATWDTAATNIQDALNASTNGDSVLVTNGIYYGGISTTNAVNIQSVNGAAVTWIDGYHTNGCASLPDGASLSGFTLTNGYAPNGGGVFCATSNVLISGCTIISNMSWGPYSGGVYSGTLTNCALINNATAYSGGDGGGVSFSTLINCTLSGNVASLSGGGAYNSTLNNCILIGNQATWGGGAISSTLNNCMLTNNVATIGTNSVGGTAALGGGIWASTANNCVLSGNHVRNPYGDTRVAEGGGAFLGTLNNCILFKNTANQHFGGGGAAYQATLNNCTVVENSAYVNAGGTYNCTVNNSIVRFNGSDYSGGTFNNSCAIPLPPGPGNINTDPLFVDIINGNLHVQTNSPCINSGNNAYITNTTDFDGNPRIVAGTVDIGAYEYQTPTSVLSYGWAQQFGLPTDGTADYADSDGDGMNNWQEWIAGTIPTNALSVLQLLSPSTTNSTGLTLSWSSVTNRTYYLQRATSLADQPAFTSLQSNLVGQTVMTSFTDTTATNVGPYFYRVGVQ